MHLPDTDTISATNTGTVARVVAAAALVTGGLVHLQLYLDGYRSLPDPNLGRSFVLNGVASVLVAVALVARRDVVVRLAGLAVTVGTLGAFAMSRRGDGVFGLRESGLEPSPQALIALVVELVALVALAATFLPALGGGTALPRRAAAGLAVAFIAAAIGGAAFWANSPTASVSSATTPGNVTISGFAFEAPSVDVTIGSTITWTNADGFAHSVVASDATFESERLATGASFTHTFDAAGSFTYICGIHPSMTGTVVVTG
jgi:plastocyanin